MKDLDKEQREDLDNAIMFPVDRKVDPETGLEPPSWWRGEEEANNSSGVFMRNLRR